ncbi:MAG TPA: hypothetical protein VG013_21895 [Gemmataceae bacterium]|jgi:hypothetical protein|nr:hypothetical protein [Gemmataceae bacterium]
MEHAPVAVQSVKDIQESEKRWLERLLGRPLGEDQQVFIMVLTPGSAPDEATRRKARAGLERIFDKTQEYAKTHGITDEEADAAVEEAMRQVRPRPG